MNRNNTRVSRRHLLQGASASAAAVPLAGAASLAGSTQGAAASNAKVHVAATVVRAAHARNLDGALRIGVRVDIRAANGFDMQRVLVVEPVPFGTSSAETGRLIALGVQQQVRDLLSTPEHLLRNEEIAVQVFGGAL